MKNIVLIVPSLRGGGMERVALRLADHFSQLQYSVCITTLNNRNTFFNIPKNIEVIKPSYNAYKLSNPFTAIRTIFFIRKIVKYKKPDVVLSFGESYNSLVISALLNIKIKLFVTNRASPNSSLNGFRGLINPFFYKYANGVIVQTEKAKQILSRRYSKSMISVIPNPIQSKNPINISSNDNIILNVGYIGGKKNQELLIEYFSELKDWKKWILYIVGDGPNLKACKERAKELRVDSNIKFTGAQKNVEELYLNSKIFAFTSTSEGFPNVLLEAMSYGIPCISFDCVAGPSELIEDNYNGFLIPEFNKNQYINKLNLLMSNEKLQSAFSTRSNQLIKKYDIAKIADQFIDVLLND